MWPTANRYTVNLARNALRDKKGTDELQSEPWQGMTDVLTCEISLK